MLAIVKGVGAALGRLGAFAERVSARLERGLFDRRLGLVAPACVSSELPSIPLSRAPQRRSKSPR